MNESTARRHLFTLLKFDIQGFINPSSIKCSALTRIDVTTNGVVSSLTTKLELEDHLLLRNPKTYWAYGFTHFVHTSLGRQLGDTRDYPLAEYILDGSFTRTDSAIRAFTCNLRRRTSLLNVLPANISERTYSHAFGGLREKSSASPSSLYNDHYMNLISKLHDSSPNPIRMIHARLIEITVTHGFAPERHQVRFDCPILNIPGNFKTENLRLVYGVKATKNQTLEIGVAWQIKRLVREHNDIFYEFQFERPHQTCFSDIILKKPT
jgi:hypothetical protein